MEDNNMDMVYCVLFQGIKCLKRVEEGQFLTLVFGFQNQSNEKKHWDEMVKEVFPGDLKVVPLWEMTWGNSLDCFTAKTTSLSSIGDICLGLLDTLEVTGSCSLCTLVGVPEGITLLDYLNFFSGSEMVH